MVSGNWGFNCYIMANKLPECVSIWALKATTYNNKTKQPWFSAWCSVAFPCFQHSFFFDKLILPVSQFIIFNLQLEEGFLSQGERKATLPSILKEIFDELNKNGKCMIQIGEFALFPLSGTVPVSSSTSQNYLVSCPNWLPQPYL